MDMGTSYHTFFEERLGDNASPVMFNSRPNIDTDDNKSLAVKNDSNFNIAKEQLESRVKSHLESLSQDLGLCKWIFLLAVTNNHFNSTILVVEAITLLTKAIASYFGEFVSFFHPVEFLNCLFCWFRPQYNGGNWEEVYTRHTGSVWLRAQEWVLQCGTTIYLSSHRSRSGWWANESDRRLLLILLWCFCGRHSEDDYGHKNFRVTVVEIRSLGIATLCPGTHCFCWELTKT